MGKHIQTIFNCILLGSFKYYKLLYKEYPHRIIRSRYQDYALINNGVNFFKQSEGICSTHIVMGQFQTKKIMQTALLHEIGHHIDYKQVSKEKVLMVMQSPKQLLNKEKAAWKHAMQLAKNYNLEMDYEAANRWLAGYGTSYKPMLNKVRCINSEKQKNIS